jgi:hypothetical protein
MNVIAHGLLGLSMETKLVMYVHAVAADSVGHRVVRLSSSDRLPHRGPSFARGRRCRLLLSAAWPTCRGRPVPVVTRNVETCGSLPTML